MLLLSLLSNLHFLFQLSILFYYLEILFTSEWDNTFFSYLYSISVSVELHFWLSLSSSMIAVHWSEVSFLPVTIKSLSWSVKTWISCQYFLFQLWLASFPLTARERYCTNLLFWLHKPRKQNDAIIHFKS